MTDRVLENGTLFSIVVPVYNEEETLELLYQRLIKAANSLPVSTEFILVNDGSKDRSLEIMCGFIDRDPRFRIVDLSRNFGHQNAVSAALSVARGEAVAILDADLQDPPELLGKMLERWAQGVDVIYGVRRSRAKENMFKLVTARLFYRILSHMAEVDIPRNAGDFRVMDKRVVDVINSMPERNRFLRGMVAWVGFRQEPFPYDRAPRAAGSTKYPFARMLSFSIDGLLSFSMTPLRWMMYLGLLMTVLGFIGAGYMLLVRLLSPEAVAPGIAGLYVAVLFMFGVNFICLGIIGEYVGRCFTNVQGRPPFIIKEIHEGEPRVSVVGKDPRNDIAAVGPSIRASAKRLND